MRKMISFIFFSIIVTVALSASIVIYQQGIALISDKVNTTSKIFKIPVSERFLEGSFFVKPVDGIYKINYYEGEEPTLKKYYEGYTGSKIKFVFDDGTIKNCLILSAEPLILKDVDTKDVYFNPNGYPIFPNELYMDSKNYFVVETYKPFDSLSYSYLTEGMSWNAKYFLTMSSDKELDFSGYFNISNDLDMGFFTYDIYLLAGEIYRPQAMYEETRFMKTASFAPSAMNIEQPVGQKTGYRVYRIDISDIPKKSNISVPIIHQEMSYEKKFVSMNPGEDYSPVNMVISITNVPIDLPAGTIEIYDLVNGVKILSGSSSIRQISKGDDLEIPYGQTTDILCKKVVKSTTRVSKTLYRDVREVSLKNLSESDVIVEVHDYASNIRTVGLENQNVEFTLPSKSEVKFVVKIAAREEQSFQYTIEYGY